MPTRANENIRAEREKIVDNGNSKFICQKRLPEIVQEIILKPEKFHSKNYSSTIENGPKLNKTNFIFESNYEFP